MMIIQFLLQTPTKIQIPTLIHHHNDAEEDKYLTYLLHVE